MGLLAAELGDEELLVDGSRYQSRRRMATAPDIRLPARELGGGRCVLVVEGRKTGEPPEAGLWHRTIHAYPYNAEIISIYIHLPAPYITSPG